MDAREFFSHVASENLTEFSWLEKQLNNEFNKADFYLSFNLVHRKIQQRPVAYSDDQLAQWSTIYPGLQPEWWDSQALARLALILNIPTGEQVAVLDNLFSTGDIGELEVLYRSLYLLPDAGRFTKRGAEGIRTNMTRVYDAIALDNPFPAEYFNDGQWNQMVLKAIFMQRPLYRIQGLDNRVNEELRRIAQDFAHERWAAGRKVTPELWRLAKGYMDDGVIEDLKKVLASSDPLEQAAGILALGDCDRDDCRELLVGHSLKNMPENWNELGYLILKNA
ncbi:EboA domain-containing protein [Fulvivirga sedimenti]|uniref:EboA domain-containing protein n=1 Tax=Fulvivirga sedimenti TaxID=2879465 RepID=A0A9X1KV44_9BACT|nr:EboA domain-containing protein [Fulvivirga sedimenti]MCA6074298.1 EboA domain-containing protein [Fulvivirga sedimenti]